MFCYERAFIVPVRFFVHATIMLLQPNETKKQQIL